MTRTTPMRVEAERHYAVGHRGVRMRVMERLPRRGEASAAVTGHDEVGTRSPRRGDRRSTAASPA